MEKVRGKREEVRGNDGNSVSIDTADREMARAVMGGGGKMVMWRLGRDGKKTDCPAVNRGDVVEVVAHERETMSALQERLRYARDLRDSKKCNGYGLDVRSAGAGVLRAVFPRERDPELVGLLAESLSVIK